MQLGYAAVCGIAGGGPPSACSGPSPRLTPALLDGVVSSFIAFAAGVLRDAGLPRSRIIAHTGVFWEGAPTPSVAFNTPAAAVTSAANPGWSMYLGACNATNDAGLAAALDAVDGAPWGAPEWLASFDRGKPQALWAAALAGTLGHRNNRLLVVQNFESVRGDPGALNALIDALSTPPACLVDAPDALVSARVNASAWALSWAPGAAADTHELRASAVPSLLPSGALAVPTLALAMLPSDANALTLVLPPGYDGQVVYWQVIARGCGGEQSMAADVVACGG